MQDPSGFLVSHSSNFTAWGESFCTQFHLRQACQLLPPPSLACIDGDLAFWDTPTSPGRMKTCRVKRGRKPGTDHLCPRPFGGLGGDLEQGFPADAVRGETSFSKEPCTSCGIGLAAVLESSFRAPQLISSAARICRGCQFRRLLSQTRPAGAWCCGGLACLLCLQGKLKGLGDQQEKELQNPCTEALKPCLWAATRKLCPAPPCVLVGGK